MNLKGKVNTKMEMNINVGVIVTWVGALSTIAGFGALTYRTIIKHFKKQMERMLEPFAESDKKITEWNKKQQADIEAAAERDALMMETQLASLEAIHEGKNNGNITDAIGKLRKYMLKQSSKTSSYAKE